MKKVLTLIACTLLLLLTAFDVSAGVRYRYFNNQLEIELTHQAGLLGYVIKSPNRNGIVEANPALNDCPAKATEVLKPGANHVHGHWILLSTCDGQSFMYKLKNTPSNWADAAEMPYTPPSEDDLHASETPKQGLLFLLVLIAAFASVISVLLLLRQGKKE